MADKISTRQQQILTLLLEHKDGLSLDEMANALAISRNAVAQHFSSLEKKGYVRACALNKTAGRPVALYSLTSAGLNYFPKQYAWFAELILTDLKQSMGTEAFSLYLQKLAHTLSQSLLPQFVDKDIEERLKQLLEIMESLGFQAKLAQNANPQLRVIEANNCIYHNLAQQHLEICQFDQTLIATLLGQPIEQISCMAKGEHICAFKLQS